LSLLRCSLLGQVVGSDCHFYFRTFPLFAICSPPKALHSVAFPFSGLHQRPPMPILTNYPCISGYRVFPPPCSYRTISLRQGNRNCGLEAGRLLWNTMGRGAGRSTKTLSLLANSLLLKLTLFFHVSPSRKGLDFFLSFFFLWPKARAAPPRLRRRFMRHCATWSRRSDLLFHFLLTIGFFDFDPFPLP